jgi:hypothetical protein
MVKKKKRAKAKPTTNDAMPYATAFVMCENVLFEPDSVPTAIRIVDIVTIDQVLPVGQGIVLPSLSLLLIMKAGEARGERTFTLRVVTPEEPPVVHSLVTWSFTFAAPPESGQTNRLYPISVIWAGYGLYYFEVVIGDRVLARTPIRLRPAEAAPQVAESRQQG